MKITHTCFDDSNNKKQTPLHIACDSGDYDSIILLISKKVDPFLKDNNDNYALNYLVMKHEHKKYFREKRNKIFTCLIDYMKNHPKCPKSENFLDSKNDVGCTCLMIACQHGQYDDIIILLNNKVDPFIKNMDGMHAFFCLTGRRETKKYYSNKKNEILSYLMDYMNNHPSKHIKKELKVQNPLATKSVDTNPIFDFGFEKSIPKTSNDSEQIFATRSFLDISGLSPKEEKDEFGGSVFSPNLVKIEKENIINDMSNYQFGNFDEQEPSKTNFEKTEKTDTDDFDLDREINLINEKYENDRLVNTNNKSQNEYPDISFDTTDNYYCMSYEQDTEDPHKIYHRIFVGYNSEDNHL